MNIFVLAAEKPLGIRPLGIFEGVGPLGKVALFEKETVLGVFNTVISNIIGVLTVCAGLWFIFQFIMGAFSWLSAGGDKTAVENAQKRITHAIIGLVIVVAAIFFIDLIGALLGLDILRPGKFILKMWP